VLRSMGAFNFNFKGTLPFESLHICYAQVTLSSTSTDHCQPETSHRPKTTAGIPWTTMTTKRVFTPWRIISEHGSRRLPNFLYYFRLFNE
jgi:hypothetical protein